MLSDNAIDNLIKPIIDRQESINISVLSMIADKVREIGALSITDINRLKILVSMGIDIRQMNNYLAKLLKLQVQDIKSMIKFVAADTYIDAQPLYDYRFRSFIPYEQNMELKRLVDSIGSQTAGTYENLSNSRATGFLIRDLQNPGILRFQSIENTYKSVIDEAIQASQSNVLDYDVAMRRTLKQLSDSGVRRLSWNSGYTQRLDTAVRRNLFDGIRVINQATEDLIGKEIDSDGKELSAHVNCAEDHEPFQGHQFTNAEWEKLQNSENFEDIDGEQFTGVERIIGIWNCRHIAKSIIIGVSKPQYTKEQLQTFIDNNHKGYTLANGKHLTMYECTQLQRQLETKIRYAKDEQIVMQHAGNIDAAKVARQRVIKYTQEYNTFSNSCGLKAQKDRTVVNGYRAIKIM